MRKRKTVAFDLDGTLARYDGWRGLEHIGEPLEGAVDAVNKLIERGYDVAIYTTRTNRKVNAGSAEQLVAPIRAWLDEHGFSSQVRIASEGKPLAFLYVTKIMGWRRVITNESWEPSMISEIIGVLESEMEVVEIDQVTVLPDGSAFTVAKFPLPADHWLYEKREKDPPPMLHRLGSGPERDEWAAKVRVAARYAIRASTGCGADMDFDPDALVQNMIIGMLGYWTVDGLGDEDWQNPDDIK